MANGPRNGAARTPTLSEAYSGEAGDAENPARPGAESEEAGPEPFEGERAVEASVLAPPEESAGARAENAMADEGSIPESGPPERAGEAPLVETAVESATGLALDAAGSVAELRTSACRRCGRGRHPNRPDRGRAWRTKWRHRR